MATFTLPQPLHLPALHRAATSTAALSPPIFLRRTNFSNPRRKPPSISISSTPNLPPKPRVSSLGRRAISTPLTPVAVAASKWLDVYWVLLQIRVVQVWFPDIPWDRKPLSVIGDMVDPYLSLVRRFSPPVFNVLDVSPFYAAVLLEVLSLVLNASLTANSPYYANLHSHY